MKVIAFGAAFLVATVATVATAPAQTLQERPEQGFLQAASSLPVDSAARTCMTRLTLDTTARVRERSCTVERARWIGSVAGSRWYAAQYRRTALVEWSQPADSVEWDEVVLMRARTDSDSVVPVWHFRTERTYEFLSDIAAASRPEGLLIELLICLNGTGGCLREYLLDTGAGLRHVNKPFASSLQARLPEGQRLHKGMTLDLVTLRGTWPVNAGTDPNCCPSLMFDYEVRLEGVDMVLVDAVLKPAKGSV